MSTLRDRWTLVGVAICGLGLAALVGRAEFVQQTRPRWRFGVQGYDPRDLLRGHYLQLRYDLEWTGPDTCGAPPPDEPWRAPDDFAPSPGFAFDPGCCLCLTRTDPDGIDPQVRQVQCHEATACDGWVMSAAMEPPVAYYIPEERAFQLEEALRTHHAEVELVIDPQGYPSLVELYLDGVPWRDRLGD